MTPDEILIENAKDYARKIKNKTAIDLTSIEKYPPENDPVSVFMAGSPGAGKTEASQWLIAQIYDGNKDAILRIDTDELRLFFSEYNGENSSLFQAATSILAEKIHDCALKNEQSFVFDGTFSRLEIARKNIERSLNKNRPVKILYVYQDPLQAWDFVKARARRDGRRVPKESFINQYFNARKTVNCLKQEFPEIEIYLLVKNIDGSTHYYRQNIDNIDNYVKEVYTPDTLENMLL